MEQTFGNPKRSASNPLGQTLKRPGLPGGIRDTNRQQKAQRIRDAALALFLSRGLEDVSVEDIMTSAALAKGSFYRYFTDQQGLVADLIAPMAEQVTTALSTAAARLQAAPGSREAREATFVWLVTALTRAIAEHRGPVQLFLQENHGPSVAPRRPILELMNRIRRLATDLADHETIGRYSPLVVVALVGATERMLLSLVHEPDALEPTVVSTALLKVLEAISPSDGSTTSAAAPAAK
jgi:AcrR family transcriptional regulator